MYKDRLGRVFGHYGIREKGEIAVGVKRHLLVAKR